MCLFVSNSYAKKIKSQSKWGKLHNSIPTVKWFVLCCYSFAQTYCFQAALIESHQYLRGKQNRCTRIYIPLVDIPLCKHGKHFMQRWFTIVSPALRNKIALSWKKKWKKTTLTIITTRKNYTFHHIETCLV